MRPSCRKAHRANRAFAARGARGTRTLHLVLIDKVRLFRTQVLKGHKVCHV